MILPIGIASRSYYADLTLALHYNVYVHVDVHVHQLEWKGFMPNQKTRRSRLCHMSH
jgi:hypothetical protein